VVEGPDVTLIPWMNIVILTVLAGLLFMLWRMWAQFRERMIDPAIEDMGVAIDNLDARADQARANARTRWGRFKAWLAGTGRR
jgi:Na+/melibiose symporter-like transporter